MKILRLLTADDEPLALELVRSYAESCRNVEIVAECASGDELESSLTVDRPDAVLLDIRMPGENVFDVLARVAGSPLFPRVVFATAYDSYAVRAFELNAVDYLVKPFTFERFSEAVARLRERISGGQPQRELAGAIRDLRSHPERLLVPDRGHLIPLPIRDIAWIEAEGDYSRIHAVTDRKYLVGRTLKEFETRLDPEQFIRIHRSAIVRAAEIREVRAEGSNRYRVILNDGTTLIVSRTRSHVLRRWMM